MSANVFYFANTCSRNHDGRTQAHMRNNITALSTMASMLPPAWSSLRPLTATYCEQTLPNGSIATPSLSRYQWPTEFYNASTALLFALSPIYFAIRYRLSRAYAHVFYVFLVAQMMHAFGTYLNHATQTLFGQVADDASVWTLLTFSVLVLASHCVNMASSRTWRQNANAPPWQGCMGVMRSRAYIILLFIGVLVGWVFVAHGLAIASTSHQAIVQAVHFMLIVGLGVALCVLCRHKTYSKWQYSCFIFSVTFLIIGATAAMLDLTLCVSDSHGHYFGTHALWHVCGAMGFVPFTHVLFPTLQIKTRCIT